MPRGVYSIEWRNPYTSPPNSLPRTLWQTETPCTLAWLEAADFRKRKILGLLRVRREKFGETGWCIGWSPLESRRKRKYKPWAKERKQKNAVRLVVGRIQKQYSIPLMQHNVIQTQLLTDPSRFGVCPLPTEKGCFIDPDRDLRVIRKIQLMSQTDL